MTMSYELFQSNQTNDLVELFTKTFGDSEGPEEGKLIGGLVDTLIETTPKQDIFVFVAKDNDTIIASILLTRLTFGQESQSFMLAPVAVHTDYQGKGIGQALIKHGLETLGSQGVKIAFTYGDPNFYTRAGFKQVTEEQFKAPLKLSYPHGWMAQSLLDSQIESLAGASTCVEGFNDPALW